jgi:hypothetical protein
MSLHLSSQMKLMGWFTNALMQIFHPGLGQGHACVRLPSAVPAAKQQYEES